MLYDSPKAHFLYPHMSLTTMPQGIYHSLALHLTEDDLEVQSGSPEPVQLVCAGAGAPCTTL